LPPALAGGIKLELYEMALAKIASFLAKAKLIFFLLPPAKAGGNSKVLKKNAIHFKHYICTLGIFANENACFI
jgi:hypothetical protein